MHSLFFGYILFTTKDCIGRFMFDEKVYQRVCKQYESASDDMIKYWKEGMIAPLHVRRRFRYSLKALRAYQDKYIGRMPMARKGIN